MEDVLALLIPLIPLSVGAVWVLGKSAFGKAVIRRIEGRSTVDDEELRAIHDELDQLRDELALARDDHADAMDRLEFAERLLLKGREEKQE